MKGWKPETRRDTKTSSPWNINLREWTWKRKKGGNSCISNRNLSVVNTDEDVVNRDS